MLHFQATEAKAKFSELLRAVESGESIVITRHGKKIAHLVPVADQERVDRIAAIERINAMRKKWARSA